MVSTTRWAAGTAILLAASLGGCASSSVAASPPLLFPQNADQILPEWIDECPSEPGLCLDVVPRNADLWVDGESLGQVHVVAPQRFLPLSPGIHRITLKSPGKDTWRAEIAVGSRPEPIMVKLAPSVP